MCEELARQLGALPYLSHDLRGRRSSARPLAIESACAALLPGIVAGELTATVADGVGRAGAPRARLGCQWRISTTFPTAPTRTWCWWPRITTGGSMLFAVHASVTSMHRRAAVHPGHDTTTGQPPAGSRPRARWSVIAGAASAVLARVRLRATALLAAEQAVLAEQCVELTKQYLLDRRQFGRQIGAISGAQASSRRRRGACRAVCRQRLVCNPAARR